MNTQELVQKYYGNKRYQSSQYFCTICRMHMPNHKTSILLHEQSQKHQENKIKVVRQGKLSKATLPHMQDRDDEDTQKPKGRNMAFATQVFHEFHQNKRKQNNEPQVSLSVQHELDRINREAKAKFKAKDSLRYGDLEGSEQKFKGEYDYKNQGHQLGEVRQNPIKTERLFDQVRNEKKWSSHLDEDGRIYFLNEVTKQRVEEKPSDYDGEYVIGEERRYDEMKYNNIDFTKRFKTEFDPEVKVQVKEVKRESKFGEGFLGQWEVVESESSAGQNEQSKDHKLPDSQEDELICQTEKELETLMLKQMRKLVEIDRLDDQARKDTYTDNKLFTSKSGFKKRANKLATKKVSLLQDGEDQ